MLRIVMLVVLAALSAHGQVMAQVNSQRMPETVPQQTSTGISASAPPRVQRNAPATDQFKCDGRIYCSQMKSCAEANYFLKHCPGVKMDGDKDGIPCEDQWCNPK